MDASGGEMVLSERIELSASPLPRECSTPELRQLHGPVSATGLGLMQVILAAKKPTLKNLASKSTHDPLATSSIATPYAQMAKPGPRLFLHRFTQPPTCRRLPK
jgi:hypothetical protein